ncbi:hypothetical protein TcCL_ESM11560, partial [Trypanosoma cruzi]
VFRLRRFLLLLRPTTLQRRNRAETSLWLPHFAFFFFHLIPPPDPEATSFTLPGFQHCGTACTCRGGGVAILVCEGPRAEAGPALPPGSRWRRRPSIQRQE